jgi:hypothetical protein
VASIRKRIGANGTTYYVQIRRKGLKPLTKSFSSRTLAQQWARKTESDLERSEYLDLREAKTIRGSSVVAMGQVWMWPASVRISNPANFSTWAPRGLGVYRSENIAGWHSGRSMRPSPA